MLRGAIDHVSPERVLGWVYSNVLPTTDSTVLAFIGSECVGAGKVNLLREDLLKAGLGDGKLGFSIPIGKRTTAEMGRVIVRLENSDFQLIQGSAIVAVPDKVLPPVPLLASSSRIEWMRQQGWLEQHEIDLARQMLQLGAYDLSLRNTKKPGEAANGAVIEPMVAARNVLSLLMMDEAEPDETEMADSAGLSDPAFLRSLAFPAAAIWSKQRDSLMVAEGPYLEPPSDGRAASPAGAVEYLIGPDRLLVIDLRYGFGPPVAAEKQSCTVFTVKAAHAAGEEAA